MRLMFRDIEIFQNECLIFAEASPISLKDVCVEKFVKQIIECEGKPMTMD